MTSTDRFLASCRDDARETMLTLANALNALHGTVNFSADELERLTTLVYQGADHLGDLALEMHEGPESPADDAA